MDAAVVAQLANALADLSNISLPNENRKAAEAVLLAFRSSNVALHSSLTLLANKTYPHDVLLYAASTVRFKVNEKGSQLDPSSLDRLKDVLFELIQDQELPPPVLRQCCLSCATIAALQPAWTNVIEDTRTKLPRKNAIELLQLLAEECSSDWRHVALPAFASGQHLEWAATTRQRFRAWSTSVLQLLLTWLHQQQQTQHHHHQQQQQQPLSVKLLDCLTAWVKLGALHHVTLELAQQTAQAGLLCIQSSNTQELTAGLGLLQELPEYATEELISSLRPSMLAVAQAACHAAAAPTPAAAAAAATPGLHHAAAWTHAFAAYVAAVPQQLLQPLDDAGGSLREALLQLSILQHVHDGQLVCLPALEAWGSLLDPDVAPWSSSSSSNAVGVGGGASSSKAAMGDAHSEGEAPGDGKELPVAFVRSCLLLLLHTSANWLQWQQSSAASEALDGEGVAAAIHNIFKLACYVLGQEKYLAVVMHVWGATLQQQGSGLLAAATAAAGPFMSGCHPAVLDQADLDLLQDHQQQQLQAALSSIAAAPAAWRLHAAVVMAAAVDSAAGGVIDPDADWDVTGPDAAQHTAHAVSCANSKGANSVAQLLSAAALALQQPAAAGTGALPQQQQQLALHFCVAVKVWAPLLVELFTSPSSPSPSAAAGGGGGNSTSSSSHANMSGLLQLLLNIAAHSEEGVGPAAAAVRAVITAALKVGWSQLHLFAPLLVQAVNAVPCSGAAEQDLLASLSGCLAAPGLGKHELHDLRLSAAQQLLQPAVAYLNALLQQLQSGTPWCALASNADSQVCHHLMKVRAVLEGRLLLQQQQGGQQGVNAEAQTDADADELADFLAAAAMDEDVLDSPNAASTQQQQQHWQDIAGIQHVQQEQQQQQRPLRIGSARTAAAAAAAGPQDPAVQLLLTQLWPQLHIIVTRHGAAGKFLHHYGKCCSRLLKIHPCLLVPQLQQFMQIVVVGIVRPGGCTLADPFAAAIEACCRQGSGVLLETGPHLMQALVELWALEEVSSLIQPGAGDAKPDLAEQILKLHTTFVRHGRVLQPSSSAAAVIEQAVAAASSCAGCCHRKVGSCALSLLSAVLAAATCEGPQQQQLLQVISRRGVQVVQGVLGALLAPSPLPRLQKAAAVLLDLAAAAELITSCSSALGPSASAAGFHPGDVTDRLQPQQILGSWMLQGAGLFVPSCLTSEEAAGIAGDCATMLSSSSSSSSGGRQTALSSSGQIAKGASRSYILSRRLKKRLRDFAEKHMRSAPVVDTEYLYLDTGLDTAM